jgi:MFS family permease
MKNRTLNIAQESGPQLAKAKLALFLSLAVFTTGQSFLFVVLPPLGRLLGFSDMHTGGILSLSALLYMISAPAWGYLSERVGRRPVLFAALLGAALTSIAFAAIIHFRLSGEVSILLALVLTAFIRAAQTLLTSGILPAAQACMADITTPAQRASGMGTLGAGIGVGVIAGAGLSWSVAGTSPVLAFAIIALLAIVALPTTAWLPEKTIRPPETIIETRLPFRQIWPFLAITMTAIAAYSILQQVTALQLHDTLGFTVDESIARGGAALMAMALAMVIVQAFAVRVLRWTVTRLLSVGALTATLAMLICTVASTYPAILAALILLGTGLGLMLTGNLASLSLKAGNGAQGKAAGMNVFAQGLGQVIGPLSGASLYSLSPQLPFLAATILLAIALLIVLRSTRNAAAEAVL